MQHMIPLRMVEEIARSGSIRSAAERMSITPSALNRRLLAIEDELEAQLFERLPTGVRLNTAGEIFISHARRQLADLERAKSQIEDLKGVRRGRVEISFDMSIRFNGFLSDEVNAYQKEFPGVSFSIKPKDTDEITEDVLSYQSDFGYALYPRTDPGITSLVSAPAQINAVMSPDHVLAKKKSLKLNQIIAFPLIIPSSGSLRDLIVSTALRQGFNLTPIMEAQLDFAAKRIEHTDIIGFEVDTPTQDTSRRQFLKRVEIIDTAIPKAYVHLVQLRGRALSVAAGRFSERIKQALSHLES